MRDCGPFDWVPEKDAGLLVYAPGVGGGWLVEDSVLVRRLLTP